MTLSSSSVQAAILVLAALDEMGGTCTKQRTIGHIQTSGYFDVQSQDLAPYPGQVSAEPRWMTLLSFGRSACVKQGWMFSGGADAWQITDNGTQFLEVLRGRFVRSVTDKGILTPASVAGRNAVRR